MKHKKFYTILLISFVVSITNSVTLKAQNKESKYEIAIDLQNFFSDGIPDKVLFKINNIKDNEIKGAYRLGIGAKYAQMKIEGTQDGDNYELWDEEKRVILSFTLGYEKHNYIKNTNLYYGVDLESFFARTNVPEGDAGDSDLFQFALIPFVGVEIPISNHFSTSVEAGIENSFLIDKTNSSDQNPDNITKTTWLVSKIQFPYTISINYKF